MSCVKFLMSRYKKQEKGCLQSKRSVSETEKDVCVCVCVCVRVYVIESVVKVGS